MATLSIYSTGDGLKCTLVYHYFILPKLWSSGLLPGQLRLLRHLGIKMAQKETTFSCFNGNNNQFQEQAQYPHHSLILTFSRSMTNTTGTGIWPWYQVRFQLVSGLYHRSCSRITICISTIIGLATGKSQIFSHNKQTTSNNAGALWTRKIGSTVRWVWTPIFRSFDSEHHVANPESHVDWVPFF